MTSARISARSLSVLLLCAVLVGLSSPALGDTKSFSAGSLIIPMDACYQAAPDRVKPGYCIDGKNPDDGVLKAYGLVYLLLKRGVTVYIVTNPNKTTIDGIDLTLVHAGGQGPPVGLYDRGSHGAVTFTGQNQVSYRGSPFVIDVANATTVTQLLGSDPLISTFTSVAIHVAYDSFQVPVAARMNGAPPRVAVFVPPDDQAGTQGSEGIPLMRAYLRRAGLDYPHAIGTVGTPGELFDLVYISDVNSGALQRNYQTVWLPHYDAWSSTDVQVLNQMAAFADQGGMIFAECASISSFEWNPGTGFFTGGNFNGDVLQTCYPGDNNGWNYHGHSTFAYDPTFACYDPVPPPSPYSGAGLSFPQPANVFAQIGDFQFFMAGGAITDFLPAKGPWNPGVQHLITSSDTHKGRNGSDILALTYKDNDPRKGQIIYFGGHLYADTDTPQTAGSRIVLNTLLLAHPNLTTVYEARSGSTLFTLGGHSLLFQGTYLENNNSIPAYRSVADTGWPFPQVLGRYAAVDVTALGLGTQSLGTSNGNVWEASTLIPPASVRQVYTSAGTGGNVALVPLTPAGVASLGQQNPFGLPAGFTQADSDALIGRIQGAALGGVDRSTSAVVGTQSLVPGGDSRPVMAYFGARDGMLHALAIDGTAGPPGTELWAFLPGEQLSTVRNNAAALDGSPNVGDMFAPIAGTRSWHTLLTLPQGRGGTSMYGVDVSDPRHPALLWQRGTPQSSVLLGNASGAAMTTLPTSQDPFQAVVVVASNNPTGASGITVTALSGLGGSLLWQWTGNYRRTLPGTPAVVPNDLPPPVALAPSGGPYNDRTYAADLEGHVWELGTATGLNGNGTAPLVDVGLTPAGNVQPIGVSPAIYRTQAQNHLALVVVTGGVDWAAAGDTYAVYAYDLDPSVRLLGQAKLLFHYQLPPGLKGYAPPTVSGNDVYLLASSGVLGGAITTTLSDPALLLRINLSSGMLTASTALTKGAGAFLSVGDGIIYGATARDLVALDPSGADRNGLLVQASGGSPLHTRAWFDPL